MEALAELAQLVRDTMPHYPRLADVPQRWVLVNSGARILPEVPGRLGDYAETQLVKRGVEIRVGTKLAAAEPHAVTLSDGARIPTETLVWRAGVVPSPLVGELGLPRSSMAATATTATTSSAPSGWPSWGSTTSTSVRAAASSGSSEATA